MGRGLARGRGLEWSGGGMQGGVKAKLKELSYGHSQSTEKKLQMESERANDLAPQRPSWETPSPSSKFGQAAEID